jgi:hypothetical protein
MAEATEEKQSGLRGMAGKGRGMAANGCGGESVIDDKYMQ